MDKVIRNSAPNISNRCHSSMNLSVSVRTLKGAAVRAMNLDIEITQVVLMRVGLDTRRRVGYETLSLLSSRKRENKHGVSPSDT